MQVGVNGVYYLFSDSGRLVGQSQTAAVDAQVLVGPDPSGLSVGQYLDDLTEEQQLTFTTWRTLMGLIDKYGIHDVSAMDLSDEMSLKIFYQNRLEIDLGPLTDMDAKSPQPGKRRPVLFQQPVGLHPPDRRGPVGVELGGRLFRDTDAVPLRPPGDAGDRRGRGRRGRDRFRGNQRDHVGKRGRGLVRHCFV